MDLTFLVNLANKAITEIERTAHWIQDMTKKFSIQQLTLSL